MPVPVYWGSDLYSSLIRPEEQLASLMRKHVYIYHGVYNNLGSKSGGKKHTLRNNAHVIYCIFQSCKN